MNARTDSELEAALRSAFASLAPEPSPSLLQRTLPVVAETPRRSSSRFAPAGSRHPWQLVAASLVVAAGVVAGIAIGTSVAPPTGGPTTSSITPGPSGATSAPPPSVEQPAAGTWDRIDLPDPAPGVFATTSAYDVVAFKGGFVAVGSSDASCVSDRYAPPPDCDAALRSLQAISNPSSVVWVSQDARSWELLPHQAAFDLGWMQHLATDGDILVATSFVNNPAQRRAGVWISDDGRSWELVATRGPTPEHLVSTAEGFIGARPTEDGPEFVASDDGREWRRLTNAGDLGPGEVMGMTAGRDGTVVAVGVTYEYSDDETQRLTITGTSWRSRDGLTWERAPTNDGHEGAWMSAAVEGDAGWVAVGLDQTTDAEPSDEMAAWTSPDGLTWTRVPTASIARAVDGYADEVVWTGEEFVASGTVAGEGGSVVAIWLSRDGATWATAEGQPALEDGTPNRLLALDGRALAVGARLTAPDHWVGVVWIASP